MIMSQMDGPSSPAMLQRLSRVGCEDQDVSGAKFGHVTYEDPWVLRTAKQTKQTSAPVSLDDEDCSPEHSLLQISTPPDVKSERTEPRDIRVFRRRFYILFLFSIISFAQYCAWNTYGPIATTAKTVFDWSNTEIAVLASMDPITYLVTMLFFSWMMDVKGLRKSMLVSTAFMFVGTGLRCVTPDSTYAIWTMGGGQLLNGLAGPVTQAAPPLLSAAWFPSHQRTTATAVAALCGSLGVAMSFVIGPAFVTDVKTEISALMPTPLNKSANVSFSIARFHDRSLSLQDSLYADAIHYWPLDQLNITLRDSPLPPASLKTLRKRSSIKRRGSSAEYWRTSVITTISDSKSDHPGLVFGRVRVEGGVANESLATNGEDAWLNLGNFINSCLGEPSLCGDGLTVSFWLKYAKPDTEKQYFMGTSGTSQGERGFLVFQDFGLDSEDHLTVKVENSTMLWQRSFPAPRDAWIHVVFTWDARGGLAIYTNGSLVSEDHTGQRTTPVSPYSTTLTVGRPNDRFLFANASFDEIGVWYRSLHPAEIRAIHERFREEEDGESFAEAKKRLIKQGKQQIMFLLYIEFGVITVLFLAVVIYFPDKPPLPPSHSARIQREDFFAGTKRIVKNSSFWTLALVYGITTGVYSGWGASLAVNLETFNVSQSAAGWLGFYATLAGIGAGLILARCADLFGGRMKAILVVLFFGSSGCFLWFALLCLRKIPYDSNSLYKSSIMGGFFVSGTIPLFYELTVESTYPVAEGVTCGLLTLVNNFFTVAFLVILTIPGVGTVWMNWCMFGACAAGIPIMLSFREKYRRLNIDNTPLTEPKGRKAQKQTLAPDSPCPSAARRLKTPLGSLLSVFQDGVISKMRKCSDSENLNTIKS
ncbi:uncharacterized protein LOC5511917 isoform X2 [Nematostella vectensis]|uniref:uncharacterized protein LOC5511917 isoform X2 n=1 Tax=Nematostella vectensis TaxID=45351 RepID=UPI00207793BB|nr:uncharacterized protein LOC5511917 isoform X2 [Nematostella vectensis]